jgi:hypothetical protein
MGREMNFDPQMRVMMPLRNPKPQVMIQSRSAHLWARSPSCQKDADFVR